MKFFFKIYAVFALVCCLFILVPEPIVRGVLKERLDVKEIGQWYKQAFKDWWIYFKSYFKEDVYGRA